jgi:hypothetical protein
MILYIGPGIGAATIIIVAIILGIVALSLVFVLMRPIKRIILKIKKLIGGK